MANRLPTEGHIAIVRPLIDDGRSVLMFRLRQQLDQRYFLAESCLDSMHLLRGCHPSDANLIVPAGFVVKLPADRITSLLTIPMLRTITRRPTNGIIPPTEKNTGAGSA